VNIRLEPPLFLWHLFQELRRRRFMLGIDDYVGLRGSLHAGFGLSSRKALRELTVALWAKSSREAEVVRTLFDRLDFPEWDSSPADSSRPFEAQGTTLEPTPSPVTGQEMPLGTGVVREPAPITRASPSLPPLSSAGIPVPDRSFVFQPIFPLTHREVAQAWRRLRRPVRAGPPVELDVEATIDRRSRVGVATPPVVVPRRRNTARLLMLVDRAGSMAPFHPYVDYVTTSIREAGWLESVSLCFFHDIPVEGADVRLLDQFGGELFPVLDPVLAEIEPLEGGQVYADPDLLKPLPLSQVLEQLPAGTDVAFISDAGAARGRYDAVRLLDTLAFIKALRVHSPRHVWLNPVPKPDWAGSTAAQLARHAPMFPLDQAGMYRAVNILRGQPPRLDRPV
jgi:uncharacterized protein